MPATMNPERFKPLGRYIFALATKRHATLAAACEATGLHYSRVYDLMMGRWKSPKVDTVAQIVHALGGSMDEAMAVMYAGAVTAKRAEKKSRRKSANPT